ncbi:MAG: DUF3793 family protein [Treponema sp.]|jgi:hypothetical protein|nr:DUF3793 family protein [Treponema sp.]
MTRGVHREFELTLAIHCAPVLAGYKPAALFPKPGWWKAAPIHKVSTCGLRCVPIKRQEKNTIIFVYRPVLLELTLRRPVIRHALPEFGYPAAGSVTEYLAFLAGRFRQSPEFPHEVGFFLGYPPEDVLGFIRHKGAHCKLCGPWKVYGDAEKSGVLFAEYARCKQKLLEHIQGGGTIFAGSFPAAV